MAYLNETGISLAVIGSRDFTDKERLFRILDKNKHKIKMIVSGGCRGADLLAQNWSEERGVPCLVCYAKWRDENGIFRRSGGFERNYAIIKFSDAVCAFWDKRSKGTANSLKIAESLNKPIKIFTFTP